MTIVERKIFIIRGGNLTAEKSMTKAEINY
jgi:hypothetical protein